MARRPGQGGRGVLRRAVALGGGLLLRPLRMVWRAGLPYLRSKNARRANAAAAMARKHWRADAPRTSLLRRAVAHAGGAVDSALLPGRRALAVLHRALSLTLQRALAFLRHLLRPRRHCRGPGAGRTPPPTPKKKNGACHYGRRPRRHPSPATSTPPPASPPRKIFTLDGEEVPQGVVNLFVDYCTRPCGPRSTVCHHLCVFEMQRSGNFTVRTSDVITHCRRYHPHKEHSVCCNEAGCSVRTRPGRDQALHVFFCHRLPPGWWK